MRSKILMIYPELGLSGSFVLHAPLSLLYASRELVRNGYDVQVFDARLHPDDWKERLTDLLDGGILLAGISVMSGTPIKSAVEIGKFIKSLDPAIKVVWGGPHATFNSANILSQDWGCDIAVSGSGAEPLYRVAEALKNNALKPGIKGVSYISGGSLVSTPPDTASFETVDYRLIPYHLIQDYGVYRQLDQHRRIFSLYSSVGCPYTCAFCSSPAEYAGIKDNKWVPLPVNDVADHIEFLVKKYRADYIYFIDDDAFVDIGHAESIIDEINRRGLKIGMGFRGARINEIKLMSEAFLEKMAKSGVDILHIGAESGSDRVLSLIEKNITVRDIIDINKKLAGFPAITAAYNLMAGIPTETMEDIAATKDLMLQLVKDNPSCIIFPVNKYRPLPGTALYRLAREKWDFKEPATLAEWSEIEFEGDFSFPWYPEGMKEYSDLLLIGSYFVDNKVNKLTSGGTLFYKLLKLINAVYRPFVMFRLRRGLYRGLFEYHIYKAFRKCFKGLV